MMVDKVIVLLIFGFLTIKSTNAINCYICGNPPNSWTCASGQQQVDCSRFNMGFDQCVTASRSGANERYKFCASGYSSGQYYISLFTAHYINSNGNINSVTLSFYSYFNVSVCNTNYCNVDISNFVSNGTTNGTSSTDSNRYNIANKMLDTMNNFFGFLGSLVKFLGQ